MFGSMSCPREIGAIPGCAHERMALAQYLASLSRLLVLAPLIKDRKTEGDRVFEGARRQGFVRVRVDGEMVDISEAPKLAKYKRHSIEVVVDRYVVRHADAPDDAARAADGRPLDRPAAIGTVVCRRIIRRNSPGRAPSAIRIPISRTRRETEAATTA